MTREAFENAIVLITTLGGSTNAVLHLIAMARSVNVPLTLDDFQNISNRVPLLADFKPSGYYVMEDLHQIGGVPAVIKMLLAEGLIHGDCMSPLLAHCHVGLGKLNRHTGNLEKAKTHLTNGVAM